MSSEARKVLLVDVGGTSMKMRVSGSDETRRQALRSYEGGRMLFLGLGTGLGSALVSDGRLEPTELAHLPYRKGRTCEDWVGKRGLKRLGKRKWRRAVADVAERLAHALQVDYVVIGGGNAAKLRELTPNLRLGDNDHAFRGGVRLWERPHEENRCSSE